MENLPWREQRKRISEKLQKNRIKRLQDLYDMQIGMIDAWMRDSWLPYTDWDFDGFNLYIYVRDEYDSSKSILKEGYRLETYTLTDLVESINGFETTVDELNVLGYYKKEV